LIFKKKIFLIFFILLILGSDHIYAHDECTDSTYEILFIGASYFTCNNLPLIFRSIIDDCGITAHVVLHTTGGPYLYNHANSSITETVIKSREWDYIVLQGAGTLTAYPDSFTYYPVITALKKLHTEIYENCTSTKMVFCMPWAFEDGMTWKGWPDDFRDMQIKIYDNTVKWADKIGFTIAPVGWAWKNVLEEKGYPLHYLHQSDWNHPSLYGSYLMACVIYCTLFLEPVNTNFHAGLVKNIAEYFQFVAWSTFNEDIDIWTEVVIENKEPEKFFLNQNFPNPFNSSTKIPYYLKEMNTVSIKIYDILGREIRSFYMKSQNAGSHFFDFDARGLASGLYYYQFTIGENVSNYKKMVYIK